MEDKYTKELAKYEKLCEKIETENPIQGFSFKIYIEPEPYARPRKSRKLEALGKNNVFYNPRSNYKKKLKKEIEEKLKEYITSPVDGEVYLNVTFGLMPPKKYTESKSKWYLLTKEIIKPTVRPDIDNWVKPVMDVLNKLLYQDDGQIVELITNKIYSTESKPFIYIRINYRENPIKLR